MGRLHPTSRFLRALVRRSVASAEENAVNRLLLMRFNLIVAIVAASLCGILFHPNQTIAQGSDPTGQGIEAPSSYVEDVEGPDQGPGVASEVDSAQAQAAAAEKSGAKVAKNIEEIVVFARKRAELLENTPISVTALSEETLRVTNTTRLDQIQNLVPNLSIFRGISGETLSVNVRGVGNFPTIYFDQGVGVYVDGVYLSRNQGSVLDIVDVQQVEVLRGPQGTLFGKNTLGGAINITTIKPKDELEAFVLLRTGSYGQIDTRSTLNVPIVPGKLAVRATFATFKHDGYVYNETRDEMLSSRNSMNFLGSLRYTPIDTLTIDVTGNWSKAQSQPNGGKCTYIEPENITDGFRATIDSIGATVRDNGGQFPADGRGGPNTYRDLCNSTSPYRVRNDAYQLAVTENVGAWGNLRWDIGDFDYVEDLALTLRSSWREQYPANRIDGDGGFYPVAVVNSLGDGPLIEILAGENQGQSVNLGGASNEQRQIQQEVQVNGSAWDGRINFVGGFFAFWEKASTNSGIIAYPGGVLGEAPVGLTPALGITSTDNWDWAIYAQGTADFTDWLSLTAGLRYTEEKKGLSRQLIQPYAIPPINFPEPVNFQGSNIFTDWTPMASLALKAPEEWLDAIRMDHLMGYFTYAKGFRGGGWNGGARSSDVRTIEPFQPETMNSFELGAKTIFFDRRMTFNVAVFLEKRQDQQIPQIISAQVSDAIPALPDVIVSNAAESTTKGFEIETQGQIIDGLLFDASVGYLDAYFNDFPGTQDARTGEPLNRAGQRFTFLPEWQAHIGAQYSWELPNFGQPQWMEGWVTPRVDWTYQGDTQYWAPELPELLQKAYSIVNVRVSYEFNENSTQIAFFGRNLSNSEFFRDSLAIGPRLTLAVLKYYEPPRWFGVELSHRF